MTLFFNLVDAENIFTVHGWWTWSDIVRSMVRDDFWQILFVWNYSSPASVHGLFLSWSWATQQWMYGLLSQTWNIIWIKSLSVDPWWSAIIWLSHYDDMTQTFWMAATLSWSTYIDNHYFTSTGMNDILVVQIDQTWLLLTWWVIWSTWSDMPFALSTDRDGSVYVWWSFSYSINILWTLLVSQWNNDWFIAAISSWWTLLWSDTVSSSGDIALTNIFVDHDDIFLAGRYDSQFMTNFFWSWSWTGNGWYDIFVAQFDREWYLQQLYREWWTGNESVSSLFVDPAGHITIAWNFTASTTLFGYQVVASWMQDIYLIKITKTWQLITWTSFGWPWFDAVQYVTFNTWWNICLAWQFQSTLSLWSTWLTSMWNDDILALYLGYHFEPLRVRRAWWSNASQWDQWRVCMVDDTNRITLWWHFVNPPGSTSTVDLLWKQVRWSWSQDFFVLESVMSIPYARIVYSSTGQSVIATLTGESTPLTIVNNSGMSTMVFDDNWYGTFLFVDDSWTLWSVTAFVNWLGKEEIISNQIVEDQIVDQEVINNELSSWEWSWSNSHVPFIVSSPIVSVWWSSEWWWSAPWLHMDDCPRGDLSPSYYDGHCESDSAFTSTMTLTHQFDLIPRQIKPFTSWSHILSVTLDRIQQPVAWFTQTTILPRSPITSWVNLLPSQKISRIIVTTWQQLIISKPCFSGLYKDVFDHRYRDSIYLLSTLCIVQWIGNNKFWPHNRVRRYEFIKILVNAYRMVNYGTVFRADSNNFLSFDDVDINDSYALYFSEAKKIWLFTWRFAYPMRFVNSDDVAVWFSRLWYTKKIAHQDLYSRADAVFLIDDLFSFSDNMLLFDNNTLLGSRLNNVYYDLIRNYQIIPRNSFKDVRFFSTFIPFRHIDKTTILSWSVGLLRSSQGYHYFEDVVGTPYQNSVVFMFRQGGIDLAQKFYPNNYLRYGELKKMIDVFSRVQKIHGSAPIIDKWLLNGNNDNAFVKRDIWMKIFPQDDAKMTLPFVTRWYAVRRLYVQ